MWCIAETGARQRRSTEYYLHCQTFLLHRPRRYRRDTVANAADLRKSGVGDEAVAARDLVTDLSISLQSGKTADILRFAPESADLPRLLHGLGCFASCGTIGLSAVFLYTSFVFKVSLPIFEASNGSL